MDRQIEMRPYESESPLRAPGAASRFSRRAGTGPAALGVIFLSLLAATAVSGADLSGTLVLLDNSGGKPSRSGDPSQGIVYFQPAARIEVQPSVEPGTMTTQDKEFRPRMLVVARGSTVSFPNADPILHNVFSVSGDNRFDLGLYGQGPGKAWTFNEEGVVRVYCNVHRKMAAYVVVLDTPHYAIPDAEGRFLLRDLPRGAGHLVVWHPRADMLSEEIDVGTSAMRHELRLRLTKPRVSSHSNKVGKPYSRSRSDY